MHPLLEKQLNLEYIETAEALQPVLERTAAAAEISLDIETTNLQATRGCVRLIQVGIESAPDVQTQYVVDCFQVNAAPLVDLFARVPKVLIQYATFEAEWLHFHYGWGFDLEKVFDTCVASWALKEKPANLVALVQRRLGLPLSKEEQMSDWSRSPLTEKQLKYAALDVAVLPQLARSLQVDLDTKGKNLEYAHQLTDLVDKKHASHHRLADASKENEARLCEKIVTVLGSVTDDETLEKYYQLTWQRTLRRGNRDKIDAVYAQRKQQLA